MRAQSFHRTMLLILLVTVMFTAAACDDGSNVSLPGTSSAPSSNTTQPETPDEPTEPTEPVAPLDSAILERAKSVDQTTTADGGQLMVAIECDAQTGGDLVYAGATGLPEGFYTGTLKPLIGGSVKFQVGSDGIGFTARQATLKQSTYTVTFADIDGGIELTLTGCPE